MTISESDSHTTGKIDVAGLLDLVEIVVDSSGVAHIRASNEYDLFFGQGYNAARDRLWQIDLWRKRGLGLLAADFGAGYLAQDRASRLFLYHGDMDAEWAAYAPETKAICEAFAAGINAYVDKTELGEAELPREFMLLGNRPARWRADDVVRIRSHSLSRNALSEVLRSNLLTPGLRKAEAMRKQLEPAIDPFVIPGVGAVPISVLDTFKLAAASVSFSKERLSAPIEDAMRWSRLNTLGEIVQQGESQGSNSWVVSADRTSSGRPIMAMDPHRLQSMPSVRYLVHLSAPGLDVIGAGEPYAPGIVMGHNGQSAFSVTIFAADQEDVYVYETQPGNGNRYRYGGDWEATTVLEEEFEVKGYAPQREALHFTRHGPVVHDDPAKQRAYAIRTVWSEPGAAPYMASLAVMRARSIDEYRVALRNWGTPSVNHLYADRSGRIGWQSAGKAPVRPNWDGLVPVPGDGRFEWAGFIDPDHMPFSGNPEGGFIASANEMNIPDDWPQQRHAAIGHEWPDRSRFERINRVLSSQASHDLGESCTLQNDLYSIPAERILAVLETTSFANSAARRAIGHLRAWDRKLGSSSSPPALFEIWLTSHLKPVLFERLAGQQSAPLIQPGDMQSLLAFLEQPENWFDQPAQAARDILLDETLAAAWVDCVVRMGPDPERWSWGQIHQLWLSHPISSAFPDVAAKYNIAATALGGDGSTPMYAPYRPEDYHTTSGPSVRMVIDVGAWDNSLFINLPGQSGDPASPHYADLLDDWLAGKYRPLAYSREAVERVATSRLELRPPAPRA